MKNEHSAALPSLYPSYQVWINFVLFVAISLCFSVVVGCENGGKDVPKPPVNATNSAGKNAPGTGETAQEPTVDHQEESAPVASQAKEPENELPVDVSPAKPSEPTGRSTLQPLPHVPGEKLTVAIMEFEDTSPGDEFARLDRALQSMLTTDLSVSRDLELVERARLQDIRRELNLLTTGYLDTETAAKLGKGVGAKAILTGSFWISDDMLRIDARLIHVETGTVILAEEITGVTSELARLEKQLAQQVLDAAGVRLSAFETADLSRQHTSSLLAASRYGQALNAEDEGDLEETHRSAAAALEIDPDFVLAQQILKQAAVLLDRARDDDFKRKVIAITRFEDSLNGYPFDHPRFDPDDYPQLLKDEGPKRALFYWISRTGVNPSALSDRMTIARTNPYDSLFENTSRNRDGDGLVSRLYLELGGADPVLFWCDVVTSDPKYAPRKPLTEQMLNPNPLSTPVWGPYPAYFFWRLPDVYGKRFKAQAWIQGDLPVALQTIETAQRICQPLISETAHLRQLEELNEILSSPKQLSLKRNEARERQQLWLLAREQIIDYHAALQDSRFGKKINSTHTPNIDEVLQDLVQQYAGSKVGTFGGRAAQVRKAQQIVDSLLEEANGSAFMARKTPVFRDSGEPTLIEVMHVAGCPHSYLSSQLRMAARLPIPTATSSDVDNGLTLSDDAETGIEKGWIPCPHCRPLRWAESERVERHLTKQLAEAIDDYIINESEVAKVKLMDLVITSQDRPTPRIGESLRRLCKHICSQPTGDRTLHAKVLQTMAKLTTPDDVSWLITLIEDTPWWDVRINASAALATIADESIPIALSKSIDREPFYYVRHGLEAARARAQETLFRMRFQEMRAKFTDGDWLSAQSIMIHLLEEIEQSEYIPSTMRLRWETDCYWKLIEISEKQGAKDTTLKHLRRVVELNPESPDYKNALGYHLANQEKDLDEAEQLLRAAITLDKKRKEKAGDVVSENPFYLDSLGFILFKQGRYTEAKEFVGRSLDFPEGQLLESYDHLGDIHWVLGEKKEAVTAWKKAIEVARDTSFDQELKVTIIKKINERDRP
ncbi:CsgG/HfaB family protein [Gimesia sp.]|uniref:CsgG/HfaB family protein n=1 Tax=Gimesia sp. TaxID=2024833 RepID=UPI0025BEF977|nr:CsgG/HfaB family protein [Gimesia sp.]|tara:strand:+ start:3476 stop:6664 length:3189 start_codon:yes stop_codon:yes gene_type:complete